MPIKRILIGLNGITIWFWVDEKTFGGLIIFRRRLKSWSIFICLPVSKKVF